MPCYRPNQAYFSVRPDGKKDLRFSVELAKRWKMGMKMPEDSIGIPCGQCRGCRLENSRCVAVRCMHELESCVSSCFVTLTYAPVFLPKDGSVHLEVMQKFTHDLRQKCARGFEYVDREGKVQFYQKTEGIRFLYCGEYGEKLSRPHYHLIIFGFDFPDKRFFKKSQGGRIYVSKILSSIWPNGFHGIGMVTFESAAYVARYCLKKVNGDKAIDHYGGKVKEFAQGSRKPGLGRFYLEKYFSDIYPRDYIIVRNRNSPNGVKTRPPRYYDDYCRDNFPKVWETVKQARLDKKNELPPDAYSYEELRKKEDLIIRRMSNWTREIEKGVNL